MRSIRSLAVTASAFVLAVGGIVLGAGSASATYSACLDTVVVNGGAPTEHTVTGACQEGTHGRFNSCVEHLQAEEGPKGEYGPGLSKEKAELACKRAAVLPAS